MLKHRSAADSDTCIAAWQVSASCTARLSPLGSVAPALWEEKKKNNTITTTDMGAADLWGAIVGTADGGRTGFPLYRRYHSPLRRNSPTVYTSYNPILLLYRCPTITAARRSTRTHRYSGKSKCRRGGTGKPLGGGWSGEDTQRWPLLCARVYNNIIIVRSF